jgi:hypothetical protein
MKCYLITKKLFEDLLLLLPCLLLLLPQLLSTCSLRMKINNGRKGFTQDHRARERAFAYLLNRALLSYLYPLSFSYIQSQFCFQLPMGEGLDV